MYKVQEWVEEHSEELSMVANFHQMSKEAVILHILDIGMQDALDMVSDAVAEELDT